jgi:hypothetical protein
MRPRPEPAPAVEPLKPVAEISAPKPSEKVIITPPPPPADKPAPPRTKEETFYDLESLEAEMARLLGREP